MSELWGDSPCPETRSARKQLGNRARADRGMLSPYLSNHPIVERDDGKFQVGLADGAAGPFETRGFAEAVARTEAQHAS